MIFGSLGLLVIGAGLLIAGISKGSTGYLALSFACSAAGGLLLLLAYASARGVTGMGALVRGGHAEGLPGAPGGQPVVMYVPVAPEVLAQLTPPPAANGGSHDADRGGGNGHTAPNEAAVAVAVEAVPVVGYDDMTAEQVIKLIASGAMTEAQLEAVRDYEVAHDARKTVLDRLARML